MHPRALHAEIEIEQRVSPNALRGFSNRVCRVPKQTCVVQDVRNPCKGATFPQFPSRMHELLCTLAHKNLRPAAGSESLRKPCASAFGNEINIPSRHPPPGPEVQFLSLHNSSIQTSHAASNLHRVLEAVSPSLRPFQMSARSPPEVLLLHCCPPAIASD